MTYRRVFIGTFQGDRDWSSEVKFFEETIVPAMKARGAISTEMINDNGDMFVATATMESFCLLIVIVLRSFVWKDGGRSFPSSPKTRSRIRGQ